MTDYKTGKQCPPPDELSKFSTGQLPSELVDDIGEHIEHCQTCSDTLVLLNGKSDTLVTGLQRGEANPESCNDADRDRVVKLIRKVGPESSADPATPTPDPQPVPVAMQQLLADLSSTGLLTADEVSKVVQSLRADQRDDAQQLAKALVRSGKLTKFQATAVYQGKTRSLVFGEYVVLDKIGAGGMGMVYRARHRRMKREVAIKVLPGGSLDNPAAIDRFYREVEAAAKLLHPNIVTAFDAGQHGKSHFLVMEYVAGQDLSQIVKQQGPLPVATAVEFVMQAARGLEYAHSEGLVHRDIKPANLLVDKKGTVKILDMGLARLTNIGAADDGLTKSGQIMGTVDYMAPEQATNTRTADARADIYSLGCTLYRLLTDTPVFAGDTIMNKMVAHMRAQPPSLRSLRQDVPEALDAVYQRMLAKQPDARQQSMSEVIQQLRESMAGAEPSLGEIASVAGGRVGEPASGSRLTQHFQDITPTDPVAPTTTQVVLEPTIMLDAPANVAVQAESPAEKTQVRRKSTSRKPPRIALALGGGAIVLLLATVVMYFVTPNGTLRVEILDPEVELTVKGTKYVLKGAEKQDITLTPGDHVLHVKRGDFEFDTKSLILKKGETVVVKVELLDGAIQVVSAGQVIGSKAIERAPLAGTVAKASASHALAPSDAVWRATAEQQAFLDAVAKLSADEQVEAVKKKLAEVNPNFGGKLTPTKEGARVVNLDIHDVTELWPVRALPHLKTLGIICSYHAPSKLSDLSPLAGLPLTSLYLNTTAVSDLSPLAGMRLTSFISMISPISDLKPLAGMPLTHFRCSVAPLSDLAPLAGMPLTTFSCDGTQVSDLGPLVGMSLTSFGCMGTQVSDLGLLVGMPLTEIDCRGTKVADLTPLKGMSLISLALSSTNVRDLTQLAGMPLQDLRIGNTAVSDLTPLAGMPLKILMCYGTRVADLSPLKGMLLTNLALDRTSVADLSELAGMPLSFLRIDIPLFHEPDEKLVRSLAPRSMGGEFFDPTPAEKFWETYLARQQAAEAFATATAKLPAEEQRQAITKRFRELNKDAVVGFGPQIRDGQIVEVTLTLTEQVADVTPLRALADLKSLTIVGGPHWLDLSPLNSTPLESLTCRELIARRNAHILKSMPKLTKIDAQPEPSATR